MASGLNDLFLDPMVRHEAAEALGAIGDADDGNIVIKTLKEFLNDSAHEVSQTCELALQRINWKKNSNHELEIQSPYDSVGNI